MKNNVNQYLKTPRKSGEIKFTTLLNNEQVSNWL